MKGNKKDINTQAVPSSEAREFAKSKGMEYYEVSAKSAGIYFYHFNDHSFDICADFNSLFLTSR